MVKKETISHNNMLYCSLPEGSLQKAHSIFFFTRPDMDKNHELKLSLFTKFSAFLPVAHFLDFTQINYKMLKNWTLLSFLLLLPLSVTAQEATDSVYEFRFVPQKDMFFVPYGKNRAELERLSQTISRYRREIADGSLPLCVDGYCNSLPGEAENLAVAKLRSNRVKSELILHHGMTERCFITHNHATTGDFVTVRLVLPVKGRGAVSAQEPADAHRPAVTDKAEEKVDEPASDEADTANEAGTADKDNLTEKASAVQQPETAGCNHSRSAFSLRANLLRWATLTPDLGMEWRINRNWGVSVNGSWTSWSWDDKNRRYALWEIAPEVRYYIGKEKRGYVGAIYKVGQFNCKFSTTGKQGDLMGGGITGGYQLRLNKALSLDFNLGIGCIHADYDKYEVIDGIRVRQGSECKNWWGPVSAGVTLMWKLF